MSPVMLPTPEEFTSLSWNHRDKAVTAARRLLRSYSGIGLATVSGDDYRTASQRTRDANAAWAESVREEARRLERELRKRARK